MKKENRSTEKLLVTSFISPDDFEYRKSEKQLEQLEKQLLDMLGEKGRNLVCQYKKVQETMVLYLIAKGVEAGLQSGGTGMEQVSAQRERYVQ